MKKLFTLVAVALMTVGANAQQTWSVVNDDGTLKDIYVANEDASEMSVVSFSTANVSGTQTSGPVSGFTDAATTPLEPQYDNSWQGLKSQVLDPDGSTFYYIQGKGNPVNLEKVTWEYVESNSTYRADWTDSYYNPDGTAGLPQNGTYITLTASVARELTVAVWINKGEREFYVVKESDKKALSQANGDISIAGYINEDVWSESDADCPEGYVGYLKYYDEILCLDEDGNDTYIIPGSKDEAAFIYITFTPEAGETYYIFNKSSQIGFSGFTFDYEDITNGISEIANSADNSNAPVYNLAGQRVTKNAKGILIQNGKKFISK